VQTNKSEQRPKRRFDTRSSSPQSHHSCVEVYGVLWCLTAVDPLRKPLENTAHGALWRLTAGFGTDLKFMVSPDLISGPRHSLKTCK